MMFTTDKARHITISVARVFGVLMAPLLCFADSSKANWPAGAANRLRIVRLDHTLVMGPHPLLGATLHRYRPGGAASVEPPPPGRSDVLSRVECVVGCPKVITSHM